MMRWLRISSGRGPGDCCWVVFQTAHFLMRLAARKELEVKLTEAIPGDYANTLKSGLISIEGSREVNDFVQDWEGTIQWIGRSPFRPNHKRKNWFVGVMALSPCRRKAWTESPSSLRACGLSVRMDSTSTKPRRPSE
jgi:peptide chain release factor